VGCQKEGKEQAKVAQKTYKKRAKCPRGLELIERS